MDGDELRYDATVEDHGHFCCEVCGAIYDFEIESSAAFEPDGFLARKWDVFVRGLCPDCAAGKRA
jgi:Fe2+ or Zn2+ uptake regulation protein